jgi:hypothetical protein
MREVNEKLPLAGIRVLDMTRVLAGVGLFQIELYIHQMRSQANHAPAYMHADLG